MKNCFVCIIENQNCNLCLNERPKIWGDRGVGLVNQKSVIISKCYCRNRFRLKALTSKSQLNGATRTKKKDTHIL